MSTFAVQDSQLSMHSIEADGFMSGTEMVIFMGEVAIAFFHKPVSVVMTSEPPASSKTPPPEAKQASIFSLVPSSTGLLPGTPT